MSADRFSTRLYRCPRCNGIHDLHETARANINWAVRQGTKRISVDAATFIEFCALFQDCLNEIDRLQGIETAQEARDQGSVN